MLSFSFRVNQIMNVFGESRYNTVILVSLVKVVQPLPWRHFTFEGHGQLEEGGVYVSPGPGAGLYEGQSPAIRPRPGLI